MNSILFILLISIFCIVVHGQGSITASPDEALVFTVAPKTADSPVFGMGFADGFVVNGIQQPVIQMTRGVTYTVDATAVPALHPLYITDSSTGAGTGTAFAGPAPGVTFTYTADLTGTGTTTLYYQCAVHANMGYQIVITDAVTPPVSSSTATPEPSSSSSTAEPEPSSSSSSSSSSSTGEPEPVSSSSTAVPEPSSTGPVASSTGGVSSSTGVPEITYTGCRPGCDINEFCDYNGTLAIYICRPLIYWSIENGYIGGGLQAYNITLNGFLQIFNTTLIHDMILLPGARLALLHGVPLLLHSLVTCPENSVIQYNVTGVPGDLTNMTGNIIEYSELTWLTSWNFTCTIEIINGTDIIPVLNPNQPNVTWTGPSPTFQASWNANGLSISRSMVASAAITNAHVSYILSFACVSVSAIVAIISFHQ